MDFTLEALYYYLAYFLTYMTFLIWELVYSMPKMIEIAIKENSGDYKKSTYGRMTNSIQLVNEMYFIRETIFNSLIYLSIILLTYILIQINIPSLVERILCCLLFVMFILVFILHPFTAVTLGSIFVENTVRWLGIPLLIRVLWKTLTNRRKTKRNLLPYILVISLLLTVLPPSFELMYKLNKKDYIGITEYIKNNPALGEKLGDSFEKFSERHSFDLKNILVYKSKHMRGYFQSSLYIKKYSYIFISSFLVDEFKADQVMGILEHEVSHHSLLGLILEFLIAFTTTFVAIYFVENRLLSLEKYNLNEFLTGLMKMVFLITLVAISANLLHTGVELLWDIMTFSTPETCTGLVGYFNRVLKEYLDQGYEFEWMRAAYKHYSVFSPHIPPIERIKKASEFCDVKIKELYP